MLEFQLVVDQNSFPHILFFIQTWLLSHWSLIGCHCVIITLRLPCSVFFSPLFNITITVPGSISSLPAFSSLSKNVELECHILANTIARYLDTRFHRNILFVINHTLRLRLRRCNTLLVAVWTGRLPIRPNTQSRLRWLIYTTSIRWSSLFFITVSYYHVISYAIINIVSHCH